MIRLDVTVPDITEMMAAGYTLIRVYTDTAEDGAFSTLDGTVALAANTTGYGYVDTDGTTSTWYKVAYYGSSPGESSKSEAQQGGTMDAYCTAFEVRQELAAASGQVTISEKHDQVLWEMALEASRLIDGYKEVPDGSYLASGSAVRYFNGTGDAFLWLDGSPAVSISQVEVEETDGTWTVWAATDYRTWPYNETPLRRVDVSHRAESNKSAWTDGRYRVRITGVWGVSTTVPYLVARACKTQVALWYKKAMQGWSESGGAPQFGMLRYRRELDREIMAILDRAKPHKSLM